MNDLYLIHKSDLAQLALYAHEFKEALKPRHGKQQKSRALVLAKETFEYLDALQLEEHFPATLESFDECAQDPTAGVAAGAASGLQNQEPTDKTEGAGFDSLPRLQCAPEPKPESMSHLTGAEIAVGRAIGAEICKKFEHVAASSTSPAADMTQEIGADVH
jgi:hypothetical protein